MCRLLDTMGTTGRARFLSKCRFNFWHTTFYF